MAPRRCPHGSVDAIILDERGRIFLGLRATEPIGWAGPAGHLDFEKDGPGFTEATARNAVVREVEEEVGLRVAHADLIWHGFVPTPCRRRDRDGELYTGHERWVFSCAVEDLSQLSVDPEVFTEWRWVSSDAIPQSLDPAWEMIFQEIGKKIFRAS